MLQIYCGDGKGKTTAAIGLVIRAAGHGIPVRLVQFLKDGTSGELNILREMKNISIETPDNFYGFVKNMTEEQKDTVRKEYTDMLKHTDDWERKMQSEAENMISSVIVMDEVLHACNYGLLSEDKLIEFVDRYREHTEIVLTGRNPSERLMEMADYISEIDKIKHPFDKGVFARKGIEL